MKNDSKSGWILFSCAWPLRVSMMKMMGHHTLESIGDKLIRHRFYAWPRAIRRKIYFIIGSTRGTVPLKSFGPGELSLVMVRDSGRVSESAVVAWEKEPINSRSVNCAVIDRAFFVGFYINILFFLCRDTTLYPPPVTSVSSGGRNGYNLCSTRAEWKWRWWGHMCMQVGNTVKLYLILL